MNAPLQLAASAKHPFPGLRPFAYPDHEYFFGREDQTYALYRLIDRSRFVAVVGSSGSGKSSLVRAGLLPLLDTETRETGGRTSACTSPDLENRMRTNSCFPCPHAHGFIQWSN